jgi:mannose-6-phosphate isomerase
VYQRMFKIKGIVQHYSWGGFEFIPQLLGIDNKEQKPFAEYWLGTHPNHPAVIENSEQKLSAFVHQNPEVLGKEAMKKFSSLPFLFKILDVRQMLSIQVHPGKESAALEFAKENEKGIALTAPHRNYKDENHKPELMVALSDFWLLHGFKKEDVLKRTLQARPELQFLLSVFDKGGYKALYEEVMHMDQQKVNEILHPLVEKIIPLYNNNELRKDSEDFWAARAAINFCKDNNYDRGIFSIYLFNLVHLKKGEGIFQPQGMPHAYLEGQNVEVMANSDNVLRAGLTDKHIDVAELMKHVAFEATLPDILNPAAAQHRVFISPASEFELHQYQIEETIENIASQSAEIWFLLSGSATLEDNGEQLHLQKGEAFFLAADTDVFIRSSSANLFRVIVPNVTKN